MTTMTDVQAEVQKIRSILSQEGWKVVNGPGDMTDPSGVVWFASGFTNGEYTVSCWGRKRGAGPSLGTTRVRLTAVKVEANPGIGQVLAWALADCASANASNPEFVSDFPAEAAWPPAAWAEMAVV